MLKTRHEICHTDHQQKGTVLFKRCYKTQSRIKTKFGYLHAFGNPEIVFPMPLSNYQMFVESNQDTILKVYSYLSNQRYVLLVGLQVEKGLNSCVEFSSKSLVFLTNKKAILSMSFSSVESSNNPPSKTFLKNGHKTSIVSCVEYDFFERLATERTKFTTIINNLQYYQSFGALITITNKVRDESKYPPYSVRTNNANRLRYRIKTFPSAGDEAAITISAIETLSPNTYSVITLNNVKLISHQIGSLVEGIFDLPDDCRDVGLHIYTPYGFSCDIGKDPSTDLAFFEEFVLC